MSAGRWFDFLDLPRQTPLLSDAREGFRDLTRHAFLQQKLGRPDHRLGVEAVAHDAAQDRICERQDRHSLVMRHEIAHDGDVAALQQPGGRIVESFVEAVAAAAAGCFERLEIAQRGVRLNHGGERRRIGCDHHIVAQPALEPEAGHAEVRILVGQLQIAGVVGGLGDAPRRPELKTIVDLPRDDAAFGALEQAAGGRAHDQRGHQILEHRSRPRDQHRPAPNRGHGMAEAEPVAGRHVALGDREIAGQPSLRREQIVAIGVECPVGDRKADR